MDLPQDGEKAIELLLRAGQLGYALSYYSLGVHYRNGECVERDMKKAKYYTGLAAMRGSVKARHNLGHLEELLDGNLSRAIKHYSIAAGAGCDKSLEVIEQCIWMDMYQKMTLRRHYVLIRKLQMR